MANFRTCDGVVKLPDGAIVSPVLMWQHGTVYWANGAAEKLESLSSDTQH
ncbi:hypothetical protein COOONC_12631 [Cooperia oncophora]